MEITEFSEKISTRESCGILLSLILYWLKKNTPVGSAYKDFKIDEICKRVYELQNKIGYEIYRFYKDKEKYQSPSLINDIRLLINEKDLFFKNPDPAVTITPTGFLNASSMKLPAFIKRYLE